MRKPCLLQIEHEVQSFDCGLEALNTYLQKFALLNEKNGSGRTYVSLEGNQVVGFYTIASTSIGYADAPERLKKGMARHPIPAVLLGRFAVDQSKQGQGLGKKLFLDAMLQAVKVSELIGVRAVVVDAKNEKARTFYLDCGFVSFDDAEQAFRLYALMKDIRKTLALHH